MLSTWFAASTNGKRRASRRRFVPRLDLLEGRTLPSTFTVLNLADSGEGSLRQAVLDANSPAFPGVDVIMFAPAVRGTIGLTTGQLSITDHLTIDGPGADQLAVSGNDQSRIFSISRASAAGHRNRTDELDVRRKRQPRAHGGGPLQRHRQLPEAPDRPVRVPARRARAIADSPRDRLAELLPDRRLAAGTDHSQPAAASAG